LDPAAAMVEIQLYCAKTLGLTPLAATNHGIDRSMLTNSIVSIATIEASNRDADQSDQSLQTGLRIPQQIEWENPRRMAVTESDAVGVVANWSHRLDFQGLSLRGTQDRQHRWLFL
jgi:hypothetical protein